MLFKINISLCEKLQRNKVVRLSVKSKVYKQSFFLSRDHACSFSDASMKTDMTSSIKEDHNV